MPLCQFAESDAMFGVTPIENMFLLEYMPSAPGDFVRVYLYGLMLCHHPQMDDSLKSMAQTLRIDEETIQNAYRYWERQGLVTRLSDHPPTYQYVAIRNAAGGHIPAPDDEVFKYRNFNASLQLLFGAELLHPQEYSMAGDWLDVMHLPQDVVLKMVQAEIARMNGKKLYPKTIFKRLNQTAIEWGKAGVRTVEEAEKMLYASGASAALAQAVVRRFGMRRQPTMDEIRLAGKWLNEYGYPEEAVMSACAETVKGTNPSFGYLDAILTAHKNSSEPIEEQLQAEKARVANVRTLLGHLGKKGAQPTPLQMQMYQSFLEQGFPFEVIVRAAQNCGERGRGTFEDIARRLDTWKKLGLMTEADVDAYRAKQGALIDKLYRVYERCGIDKKPGLSDIEIMDVWQQSAGDELIDFAAECARGTQAPIKYMDKLLSSWRASGISDVSAARQAHEAAKAGAKPHAASASTVGTYQQREAREEDYGNDFFVDVIAETRDRKK